MEKRLPRPHKSNSQKSSHAEHDEGTATKSKRIRLHKYIANCGYTSRRRAELLIQAGRVELNGRLITSLGTTLDPRKDVVVVNGEKVRPPKPLTIMLNKPPGILTSTHDTHDRLTVMDILPRSLHIAGVLPAGRLDQDTEGLLVLTNDGDLGHRITHPRYETEKEYIAAVSGCPSDRNLRKLQTGVVIDGKKTSPARVVAEKPGTAESTIRVVLKEGRKRQIRRMFQVIGHTVLSLRRLRVGGLLLGDLPRGEWRELDTDNIEQLTGVSPRSDEKSS